MNEEKNALIEEAEKHLPHEVFKMLGQYMSQRTEIEVACSVDVSEGTPGCTDPIVRAE